MIVEREDNSALYFIVGALLVAVAAFAIYYFASGQQSGTVSGETAQAGVSASNIAPSSGSDAGTSNSMTLSTSPSGGATATTTQQ